MDIRATLKPTGHFGSRGEIYEIWLGDELLAKGISPEFKACRLLQARGYDGDLYLSRLERTGWDMKIPIAIGAKKAVLESSKIGPRFVKYTPHPHATSRL